MRWIHPSGKEVWVSDGRYRMDWDKKAPSKGAQSVKDFLHKYCRTAVWFEEYPLPGTRLRVDFLSPNKKLALEFNGVQHHKYIPHFHKSRAGFLASIKRDYKKEEILTKNNYVFIEIYNEDLPLNRAFFKEQYNILI